MLGQLSFFQKSKVIVVYVLFGMFVAGCEKRPGCILHWYHEDPIQPCEAECNKVESCDDEECREDCWERCFKELKKEEEKICRRSREREKERRDREGWP